jgi:hypothetical protein
MTSSTHGGRGVIVLGDHDTGERIETLLAGRAGECGVTVTETYTFDPGQPGALADLAQVDAVVIALSEPGHRGPVRRLGAFPARGPRP